MLDLSKVLVAAEVMQLAAVLSGDAQYLLRETVKRCENAPFVHVAGDLQVPGDLAMDWESAPWRDANVCGLVVVGNLTVEGSLTNFDLNSGPVLLVLGSVTADRIVQSGASWFIRDDVRVARTLFGVYNDGTLRVGGNLGAAAVINDDHDLSVAGTISGIEIDDRHGHAWLAEGLVNEDGDVEWDEVFERAKRDEPLTRETPAAVDIHTAAAEPGTALLAIALARKPDLEAKDTHGDTPLLIAVGNGRLESAKLLLEAGASVAAVDDAGRGVLHSLAYFANEEMLDLVLAHDPPLDRPDKEGRTPMVRAIDYRNLAVVRALHALGVKLPPPDRSKDGFPYSLELAEQRNVDFLEFLVDHGADLDFTDTNILSDSYTLLHEASWRGSTRSVELLLRAGLAPDARDAKGRTPLRVMLDLAPRVMENKPGAAAKIAMRLLDAGADPLAKAGDGRDSLDAAMAGTDDVVLRVVFDAAAKRGSLDAARKTAVEKRLKAAR